jgi:hypothetical protein
MSAEGLQLSLHRLASRDAPAGNDDCRSFACERERSCAPDAGAPTRDEHDFVSVASLRRQLCVLR